MFNWIIGYFLTTMMLFQTTSTSLELQITNSKSDKGLIRVLIFDQEDGFPESHDKAKWALSLPIKNRSANFNLNSLPPGRYAICAFHDEDENGLIDKNKFGYPLDRFGFSNNPMIMLSIPSFKKCQFEIKKDVKNTVTIKLRN